MHPLSSFKYCPKCGVVGFRENNFKSKICDSCGFVYYFNASASTAAFIVNPENQLLVARRAKEPAKGTLDLPGGFVDLHETAEEAIIREIKEETGLSVFGPRYLFSLPNIYVYSELEIHTVDLFYEIRVDANISFRPDDDVSELFFISREEIKPELFGLKSIQKGVEIWLNSKFDL